MKKEFPQIFSPISIAGVNFKNRIWTAPAGAHLLSGREEYPNDHVIAYYAKKASGGAACITVSAQNMDIYKPYDPVHANENIFHPETHRFWNQLTDAIHFYGAKASLELLGFAYHGYDQNGNLIEYSVNGEDGTVALDGASMESIANLYADAAENAVKCGFDMILIHGGHGLILSQMLSPIFNERRDEFGGSLENRAKFPIMILDAIRARVGRKLLIEYRISGSELIGVTSEQLLAANSMEECIALQAGKGFTADDCIAFLEMIQEKIDIAHISAGSFYSETEHIMHPNHYLPAGVNTYLAEYIKKSGRIHLPILSLGGYQMPQDIENALAAGRCDLIATARGSIADCEHVKKAKEGRSDEIIPCIRCFHCLDYTRAATFGCSVNPTVGREKRYEDLCRNQGAFRKKKVLVIGGGPAGMSAAITAHQRGHEVLLVEKEDALGGKLFYARQVPFKKDLLKFLNYQIHMVEKLGIKFMLQTEVDAKFIAKDAPDVILVATGGRAFVPTALETNLNENAKGTTVIKVEELYRELEQNLRKYAGKKAVIIGGGEAGCELSVYLERYCDVSCTVLEMTDEFCRESFDIPQFADIEAMRAEGVKGVTRASVQRITECGVIYKDRNGREMAEEGDLVVLATGYRPVPENYMNYANLAEEVIEIGDCKKVGNVRTSVRMGYEAALQL